MNHTKIYYTLKPFIPRYLQIALRRQWVKRKRRLYSHIWPIDPKAGTPPQNWPGWPEKKQFCLVLSHDVDTQAGHDKCLKLLSLEKQMGFRSAFSFVPERYTVSEEIRREITANGFEVCVHGLNHDGRLFSSRKIFDERVIRINEYLRDWGAVGFTSPSMHHNLDWMHALDITHDTSTFDTDPFEPQPDAVETVFPLWIRNHQASRGYVELPYTLPQDHTLFIMLQERTNDIWKQKLDWIAEKGGMVLLNCHPDYMQFADEKPHLESYPVSLYQDFLEYIRQTYAGKYWHALPREAASFCANNFSGRIRETENFFTADAGTEVDSAISRSPKKACMLVYSFYEKDNRVKRYAESLVKEGFDVDVISLRTEDQPSFGSVNGVNVHRIQKRVRNERSKISYLLKLIAFFLKSFMYVTCKHVTSKYQIIHVHSVPDFEVFAAVIPKLMGAKIILDIHDIVPEFYAGKFGAAKDSMLVKCLVFVEKISCQFADHVIISNDLWFRKITRRSVCDDKCTPILNFADQAVFHRDGTKKSARNGFVMLYPGSLNWHQGLDIAVKAFSRIANKAPEMEFHIYGDGPMKPTLKQLIQDLNLEDRVKLFDSVSIDQIAEIMKNADLGIIPKRNDPFGGEAFSTKTLEFMSCGVPIVLSRTKIDQYYFNDAIVKFFEPENEDDLAAAILALYRDKKARELQTEKAFLFAEVNTWEVKNQIYLDIIDKLLMRQRAF